MDQVLPKLPAKSLDRRLGNGKWNNEADIVLRRRLEKSAGYPPNCRSRRKGAA